MVIMGAAASVLSSSNAPQPDQLAGMALSHDEERRCRVSAAFSRIEYQQEVLVDGGTERKSRAIAFHATNHQGDLSLLDITACLDTMLHDLGAEDFNRTEKNIAARGYDAAATTLFTNRCLLWHLMKPPRDSGDSHQKLPPLLLLPFNVDAARKCWERYAWRGRRDQPSGPATAGDATVPLEGGTHSQ